MANRNIYIALCNDNNMYAVDILEREIGHLNPDGSLKDIEISGFEECMYVGGGDLSIKKNVPNVSEEELEKRVEFEEKYGDKIERAESFLYEVKESGFDPESVYFNPIGKARLLVKYCPQLQLLKGRWGNKEKIQDIADKGTSPKVGIVFRDKCSQAKKILNGRSLDTKF